MLLSSIIVEKSKYKQQNYFLCLDGKFAFDKLVSALYEKRFSQVTASLVKEQRD